jgi:peptide/nickel transport system substrate-binding protein
VTRHVVWQAALALLGIAVVFLVLFQLASSQPPPETQETVEVPAAGGTYVEGILGYWETINPVLAPTIVGANPTDQDLTSLVFDGLTSLDATGQISPSLAIDWDVSEDGTVYEFHLRQDVTWHDGAPLTATDVVFTIQAMQDPGYQGDRSLQELWRTVVVEEVDTHTVRMRLQELFPSFLFYTTTGLLPSHLLSEVPAADLPWHDFSTKQPVGTGQFMVQEVSDDQVVLVPNPNYWGRKPLLSEVAFWFYGDWDGLLTDYQEDGIQGFHPPGIEERSTLAGMSQLQLYSALSAGYGTVYLNLGADSVPFFQDQEVRQALLYALDRQALINQALDGQGVVADSPIPPFNWAHDPGVRRYGYDPERAVGLLDASGWMDSNADRIRDKDGVELSFTLLTRDDAVGVAMAEELARQWQAVGVAATVRSVSSEAAADFVRKRDFEAALVEIGLTADPDPYPLWHSTQAESGQNYSGFASEEADLVMEEARFTADREQRAELYQAFQRIFAEEVPSILLYYPIYTYAVDAQVHEVQIPPLLHTSDRFRNIADWYVEMREVEITETDGLDKTGE